MKEVMAFIRMNKMNETKEALSAIGLSSFTARKVMGRGKGMVDVTVLDGARAGAPEAISQLGQGLRLIPKRAITMIVQDDKVEEIAQTIIKINQTGKPGDGKIFVMPVMDAIKIRTGESGEMVIDNPEDS
ncbi:MAG: P-II family nitrogen regulator [Planctomycetes bacterium]|nr:P-II family nitrogen regulator [Planctomycetota bacterium]